MHLAHRAGRYRLPARSASPVCEPADRPAQSPSAAPRPSSPRCPRAHGPEKHCVASAGIPSAAAGSRPGSRAGQGNRRCLRTGDARQATRRRSDGRRCAAVIDEGSERPDPVLPRTRLATPVLGGGIRQSRMNGSIVRADGFRQVRPNPHPQLSSCPRSIPARQGDEDGLAIHSALAIPATVVAVHAGMRCPDRTSPQRLSRCSASAPE